MCAFAPTVSTIAPIAGKPATSLWPAAVATELNSLLLHIAACAEAFGHVTANHQLQITFTHFSDRMEVALSHLGEDSPAIGLDTIAGFAAQLGGAGSLQVVFAGFDRVQYETLGGDAVTRLTKYIGQVPPRI